MPDDVPAYDLEAFVRVESSDSPVFDDTGRWMAFRSNRSGVWQAWLCDLDTSEVTPLTDTGGVIYQLAMRPGHRELLYVADDGGDEQFQLHLLDLDMLQSRPLASRPRVIHNVGAWSSDGRLLSYASNLREPSAFDLYVLDVDADDERLVLEQDGMLEAGRFAPNGADDTHVLARQVNLDYPGDSTLLRVGLGDEHTVEVLTAHSDLSDWFVAHELASGAVLALTNDGRDFTGLQRIDPTSGAREYLVERDWDIEGWAISPDERRIALVLNEDGVSRIEAYRLTSDGRLGDAIALPALPSGAVVTSVTWRSGRNSLVCAAETPRHIPDLWELPEGEAEPRRLTTGDARGLPLEELPLPQVVRYPSFDGREIPAFLYLPEHPTRPGPLPCLVLVHGGPEMQSRPPLWARYSAPQYLLARGDVALLVPNVRGSTGYGKAYSHADDVELRMDSVRDLLAAVDWLTGSGQVDPTRIGVMGGSYGGFMVLAAITEAPERWAAAIDLYGIANFETFLEHTGAWRRKHRAREYGTDPAFLHSISPIHRAGEIRCPLLVFQGDHDVRVPPEESEQIVEMVRHNEGDVEYVVYPEEGHGFHKVAHRLDLARRVVEFVERTLISPPASH
ncbi:MAG: S9 family peptidase [Dehalococcoidia bacterium]|nr:S9 family peptidase [Dehalococcoidia bacterium]